MDSLRGTGKDCAGLGTTAQGTRDVEGEGGGGGWRQSHHTPPIPDRDCRGVTVDKGKATRFFEVASKWVVKAAELVNQDQDGVVISFQIFGVGRILLIRSFQHAVGLSKECRGIWMSEGMIANDEKMN